MPHWHYHHADLKVASEIEIPEWADFAAETSFPVSDVGISLAPVLRKPGCGGRADRALFQPSVSPSELTFAVPEIGHYRVRQGREIAVTPAGGVTARQLLPFLLGPAWAALCYQRQRLILHVSAVEVDGVAVAFAGPPGAGKSSLAARLIAQGFPLLADDIACVDVREEGAWIHRSTPRMKLWRTALRAMGWDSQGLERDHFRLEKFHLAPPPGVEGPGSRPQSPLPVPLGMLFLLGWGPLSIQRLSGLSAVRGLVASATYRGHWLEPMGQVAGHWQRCTALARCLPIHELCRPRAWTAMDAVVGLLLKEVRNLPVLRQKIH